MLSVVFVHIYGNTVVDYSDTIMAKALLILSLLSMGANAFFLITIGYNTKKQEVRKYLQKTYKTYLKPYIVAMLFVVFLFPIVHFLTFRWWPGAINETIKYLLAFVFGISGGHNTIVFGYQVYECSVVYFLLICFISTNIFNLILKTNKRIQPFIVLLFVVAGYLLCKLGFFYYCIPQGLFSVLYIYIGYLLNEYLILEKKKAKSIIAIFSIISFVYSLIYESSISFAFCKWNNFFIDNVVTLGCGLLLILLETLIEEHTKPCFIKSQIKKIGFYVPWIMCIHSVEMSCIPWYILRLNFINDKNIVLIIEYVLRIILINLCCIGIKKYKKYTYKLIKE